MKDYGDLKFHLDDQGRLTGWPSPKKGKGLQEMALEFMAEKFELGKHYSEREVNDLLNAHHTFGDAALLRREMVERGYLQRLKDGSTYWRPAKDENPQRDMGSRGFG